MFSAFCGMYFYTGFKGLDGREIAFLLDFLQLKPRGSQQIQLDCPNKSYL